MKSFAKKIGKALLVLFVLLNVVVLFHAYKLTHFYDSGYNKPLKQKADKSRWEITKDILFGVAAVKQPNPPPDTMYSTTYLVTNDNLRLEAWERKSLTPRGTVIIFHGHGGKKSSMLNEAGVFNSLGYNVMLMDFRAHGGSQGNTCSIGFYESEDVKLAYDYLAAKGERNIILFGASLGAATITKAVKDYGLTPARIILDMPFASLTDAVSGRLKIMHLPVEPLSTMLTFWGGTTQGFWAFNHRPYEYVRTIKCPVLLQRGEKDPRVTQAETEKIYANISSPKRLVTYANSAHESLCNKEREKWTREVTAFLQ